MAAEPKQSLLGLQAPATPNMERLYWFHNNLLLVVITGIVVFVFILLVWVAIRYNAKSNPEPSKTTHHVMLEVVWTIVPVLILIIIAVPSYKILYYLDRTAEPDMTLKVTGFQWYWTYQYPDHEDLEVESRMIPDEELDEFIADGKGRRLLETYNPVVLPIGKNVQIILTANDVIHAWTVPSFGVKKDAVPGRTNETWFRVTSPGVYFGQCSEICGIDHAKMPISVYAVTQDEFDNWLACVSGEEANADYPSRACVQKFGFDKYRYADAGASQEDAGASQEEAAHIQNINDINDNTTGAAE